MRADSTVQELGEGDFSFCAICCASAALARAAVSFQMIFARFHSNPSASRLAVRATLLELGALKQEIGLGSH
jgi:hypothetical protein